MSVLPTELPVLAYPYVIKVHRGNKHNYVVVTGKEVLPGIEDMTADPSRWFYLNTMSP